MLGKNQSVRLVNCRKVIKVDSLATVPVVTIIDCEEVIDYCCLKNVSRLKILPWRKCIL